MSDLQLDIIEALDSARVNEVPYVVALNKRTNKQKLQFLRGMQEAINSLHDKNITAIRLLDTLKLMHKAVQNKETITLEG